MSVTAMLGPVSARRRLCRLRRYLTPPEIGKLLGVKPAKVITWIRNGELRAIDTSATPGKCRPRYVVEPADFEAFKNRRGAKPIPKVTRRRRKQKREGFVEYF